MLLFYCIVCVYSFFNVYYLRVVDEVITDIVVMICLRLKAELIMNAPGFFVGCGAQKPQVFLQYFIAKRDL